MPVEVEPPELARLLDLAERPRVHDWSLRAALSRYAQPQPERASVVLELVRRIEVAIRAHLREIERDGAELWRTLQAADSSRPTAGMVGLLRAMVDLDRLGDVLAAWAVDGTGERPDATVDAVTADVARRLAQLGVLSEERQRPPRQRG